MSNKAIFVGVHFNRKGERVIEYGGETICTVAEMREMLEICDAAADAAPLYDWAKDHKEWLKHYHTARNRNAI